jgi:PAS domain S-box-containing protein
MNFNGSSHSIDNKRPSIHYSDSYLAVFDDLPAMMWKSGVDGGCDYFNRSWLAFTGRTMEEELGSGWLEGVHPDDRDACLATYREAFERRESFEMEYRLRHHSGVYRWIHDLGQPIKNPDGNFAGYIGTCFDLTEKKELEQALIDTSTALAESNAALRENEEMFKGLFEHAPDAVIAVDQDGKIVLVNVQGEEVFGYSREEMIGQPVEMLMPGAFSRRHKKHLAEYMKDPHVRPMGISLPLYGKRKDGSLFPADINLGPLHMAGKVMVMATVRDTTDRKKAEEAILEREKLLTTAAQAAPINFFRIDQQGVVRFSLGQGLSRHLDQLELEGKSIYDLYREMPGAIEGFRRALAGETHTSMLEAGARVYETTYAPLSSEEGEIHGVVGVSSDVTRHRQVEEALLEREAHFRTIFNNTTLGIFLLDTRGRMIETNMEMQSLLGYSDEELRKMDFSALVQPEDRTSVQKMMSDLQQGKTEGFQAEKRFASKDNRILWFRITLSLFREENGAPRFGIGMMENITTQKQMEAELAEVQRRLADSAELERLNLAQELHDGPLQDLQAMSFKLALLETFPDDAEAQAELRSLQDELGRAVRSIRSTCGELRPPSLAPFGLQKAIESHAEHFREENDQIQVELDLMRDAKMLPERVRMALFRIYQQSMVNIARHSGARRVQVVFRFNDQQIELGITDDGKGFDIPGRWVDLVRQGHFGLVGSKERAESIGGRLEIQSAPGSGTAIMVTVPRREQDQVPAKERYSETTAGS